MKLRGVVFARKLRPTVVRRTVILDQLTDDLPCLTAYIHEAFRLPQFPSMRGYIICRKKTRFEPSVRLFIVAIADDASTE